MIRFSDQEGFIKAKGIKFKEGQDSSIRLPKVAVGVFSRYLFYDVVQKFNCREVGILKCANVEREVFILNYKGNEITFFMAGVSGPWISADMEELHAQGVDKFIIFGNCGVLDANIEDCSIIIPTKAFRDEGTSYHYAPASDMIDIDLKYEKDFLEILDKFKFDYTKGYTWTIDAFFRETPEKVEYFKENGAVCVEMEGATIAAVAKRLGVDYFTFYYAGDNLDCVEWDERSLSGLVNIDKKKEVMTLALELAIKINNCEDRIIHEMRLHDAPFKLIQNGTKTIEMRLYDEKRKEIKVGDEIIFTNRITDEKISTKVIAMHIYSCFTDLYRDYDKILLGYSADEVAKAEDMEQYYSKEEQEKYGVVGIEIQLQ